jgi:hypothetical protein
MRRLHDMRAGRDRRPRCRPGKAERADSSSEPSRPEPFPRREKPDGCTLFPSAGAAPGCIAQGRQRLAKNRHAVRLRGSGVFTNRTVSGGSDCLVTSAATPPKPANCLVTSAAAGDVERARVQAAPAAAGGRVILPVRRSAAGARSDVAEQRKEAVDR